MRSPREVPESFLQGSAAEHAAPFVNELMASMAPDPDERIGAWRLLQELGHGGMGTVYLAERADAGFVQRVALKVVRGTFTLDDHLVSRFREERKILAALEHPGVARLVDGGVTQDGLPWYAMEYVEGVPITVFARGSALSVPARLRLFLGVCDAVAYAHRQLVVHRDLTPRNVLVSADGRPRLVDFGVAIVMADAAAAIEPLPRATRGYASPEQLRGDPIAVTDDVYALGVILRELLSDAQPNSSTDRVPLRGDLLAIVNTAVAPGAGDRYPSVDSLAGDVRRHLALLPVSVLAHDPLYRAERFVARHRLAVLGAAVGVLSLVGGIALTLREAQRADRERDAAQAAAASANEVSEFLTRVLSLADPVETPGATITVSAAIDSAASWLEGDLATAPEQRANLTLVLAELYGATGQPAKHQRLAEQALTMQEALWGPDDPRLAATMGVVAESRWTTHELSRSEPLLRRMIALAARDSALGLYNGVHGRNLLAISLRDQGRFEEAEAVLQELLADRELLNEVYPVGLNHVLTGLGHLALAGQRADEASGYYREVLDRRRRALGDSHPEVANALINLARARAQANAFDESLALFDEGLAMRRDTQGNDHAEIGVDMAGLGEIQSQAGDTVAAQRTNREAYTRLLRTHGAEHPLTREVAARLEAGGTAG